MEHRFIQLDESFMDGLKRSLDAFRRWCSERADGLKEFEDRFLVPTQVSPLSANLFGETMGRIEDECGRGAATLISFMLLLNGHRHPQVTPLLRDEEIETFSRWSRLYTLTLAQAFGYRYGPNALASIFYSFESPEPWLEILRADGARLRLSADRHTIFSLVEMVADALSAFAKVNPIPPGDPDQVTLKYAHAILSEIIGED